MAAIELETVSGDEQAPPLPDVPTVPTAPTSGRGRTPVELFAAAVAFLIPIAYLPSGLEAGEWSLRIAILLVVVGVGLPMLLSQARGPRPLAARSAVAFLLIGLTSAILSHNHTTAFFGLYDEAGGLLFMASLAAAWAVGRNIRHEARPLIELALLFGVLGNVGIAVLASAVDLSSLKAGLVDPTGRASGLAGNPVHLGALAVLGLALMVPRLVAAPKIWIVPVVATVAAVQLSGTRVALAVIVAIVIWAARRHGVRVGAALAVLVVIGLAVGSALGSPGGTSATGRTVQASDNWQARPATWLSAGHAVVQRPLLGIGPGQFRTATSPLRSLSVGRLEGPDQLFDDAHNIFVEYATTTGLLGVGALILWLMAASRRARGCLLAGTLALLAVHLFEPQSVVTTPLAFLALGASGSVGGARPRSGRPALHRIASACWLVAAISAAVILLAGEFDLRQAQLDFRTAPASQAQQILPAWPRPASLLALVYLYEGIVRHDEADFRAGRSWQLLALQRDDTDPRLWNDLADWDASQGATASANAEYLSALRFNPVSVRAMDGLARVAHSRCDLNAERYWQQRSLQLSPVIPAPSGRTTALPSTGCTMPGHP